MVSDRFNHQNRRQWQRLYSKSCNGQSLRVALVLPLLG
nr:MAG TPA: hypothetical protein [Caudoviricetes sp.]